MKNLPLKNFSQGPASGLDRVFDLHLAGVGVRL